MDLKELTQLVEQEIKEGIQSKRTEINEMLLTIYLAEEAGAQVKGMTKKSVRDVERDANIPEAAFEEESERAWAQANAIVNWMKSSKDFSGALNGLKYVVWTGQKNLKDWVDQPNPGNPTDVLLSWGEPKVGPFLGISAKSTKDSKGTVPFKNPGVPPYAEKYFEPVRNKVWAKLSKEFPTLKLSQYTTAKDRKGYIRTFLKAVKATEEEKLAGLDVKFEPGTTEEQKLLKVRLYQEGGKILKKIRDLIGQHIEDATDRDIKKEFRQVWLNAGVSVPQFIVVTGRGKGEFVPSDKGGLESTSSPDYKATVIEPRTSPISKAITSDQIWWEDSGNTALWVLGRSPSGSQRKLFKIRAKWESLPIVSSLKLSGEGTMGYLAKEDGPYALRENKQLAKQNILKETKDLTKQNITYKMLVETIEEEMRLMETANTLGADVNEILMGYYAGGGNWNIYGDQKNDVIKGLEQRKAQISPEEYADQDGRAKAQALASLEWAAANGFDGKLVRTWWTARPGVLAKAVETDVDSKKNPTDTLYKFSSDAFLGVSAKSTKGKGEIGFKNPGIGSLGKALGVDLAGVAKPMLLKVSEKLDWGDAKNIRGKKTIS